MKNFEFLFCFLLCVVPCIFAQNKNVNVTTEFEMDMMARMIGLKRQDVQECLDKANTDLDTIMELSHSVLKVNSTETPESVKKVGCYGACLYKKNGVLVNNKVMPEKVLEYVPEETKSREDVAFLREMFIKCSNLASSQTDECDIIVSFSRCVMQDVANRN